MNAAALGCGIASGGRTSAQPPHDIDSSKCTEWRASWPDRVEQFDPDLVVVLTGPWDLPDRTLPGWGAMRAIGDPTFDAWLIGQYQAARDVFAAGGATVVWLTAPCTGTVWTGFAIAATGAFENTRIDALNRSILPALTGVRVVDLHAAACPGGGFSNDLGGVDPARPDGLHFVEQAGLYIADVIGPQIIAG